MRTMIRYKNIWSQVGKYYLALLAMLLVLPSTGLAQNSCQSRVYLITGYQGFNISPSPLGINEANTTWQIVQDPDGGQAVPYSPVVYYDPEIVPEYWNLAAFESATPLSQEDMKIIAPSNNGVETPGLYVYQTEFCLSASTQDITLNLAYLADNQGEIYLNGQPIQASQPLGDLTNLRQFTVTDLSKFNLSTATVENSNILEVRVTNAPQDNGPLNPTGICLYAEITSNTGCVNSGCIDTPPELCDTCSTFKPIIGEEYWVSAWVSVESPTVPKTYDQGAGSPNLVLDFPGSGATGISFSPSGEIIDGWQRIVGRFTVPSGTDGVEVGMRANTTYDTYFDDIRIHPFNASMKSYVYDGETFWLLSELDDNNYATFYEYDEEGGLVRIKKETARGVVTIQETRSNTTKKDN